MLSALRGLIVAAALGAAAAPLLAAAVLSAQGESMRAAVGIDNFTFTPQRLTVKAGATITWVNKDDIPHAIAAVNRLFKSKALDTDDSYSFKFITPGTYEYFCSLHPHMTGTIVVEPDTGGNGPH
jgi:plastocyanin